MRDLSDTILLCQQNYAILSYPGKVTHVSTITCFTCTTQDAQSCHVITISQHKISKMPTILTISGLEPATPGWPAHGDNDWTNENTCMIDLIGFYHDPLEIKKMASNVMFRDETYGEGG